MISILDLQLPEGCRISSYVALALIPSGKYSVRRTQLCLDLLSDKCCRIRLKMYSSQVKGHGRPDAGCSKFIFYSEICDWPNQGMTFCHKNTVWQTNQSQAQGPKIVLFPCDSGLCLCALITVTRRFKIVQNEAVRIIIGALRLLQ